jgi:hypothetical protein
VKAIFLVLLLVQGAPSSGPGTGVQRPVGVTVSGRVFAAAAQVSPAPARPTVTLLPRTPGLMPPYPRAQLNGDLTYEISNVPPGMYSVQVSGIGSLVTKDDVVITVADRDLVGIDVAMVDTGVASKLEGLVQAWSLAGT